MDDLEHAYLLTESELLLLLSLLDSRPVLLFSSPEEGRGEAVKWEQTALSLCRDGLAECGPDGLSAAGGLKRLLLGMKEAGTVWAGAGVRDGGPLQLLLSGTPPVLVKTAPGVRRLEAFGGTAEQWLDGALGLPGRLLEEKEAEAAMREEGMREALDGCLAGAVPFGRPETEWLRRQEVYAVVTRYRRDGSAVGRWVWMRCGTDTALLRQTPEQESVQLDSRRARALVTAEREDGYDPG